jgi:hypothetical protein
LNVLGFNDVQLRETHTEGPLVHEQGALEFEIIIEKLNREESPGIDQIPTAFITEAVEKFTLRSTNLFYKE